MEVNFYLCDIEHSKRCDSKLEYLSTCILIPSDPGAIEWNTHQIQNIGARKNRLLNKSNHHGY